MFGSFQGQNTNDLLCGLGESGYGLKRTRNKTDICLLTKVIIYQLFIYNFPLYYFQNNSPNIY